MSIEIVIDGMPSIGAALQTMARRLKLSMTALVDTGGVQNGSLISIGTGTSRTKDMSIGPLFRVLQAVGWEMAGRTKDPRGIVIHPEGGIEMLITAADGGRLDVSVGGFEDIAKLLNTMAAANGMTVTGVNKLAKIGGGSLIAVAKGSGANQDIRINPLFQFVQAAQFELLIRPVHASRRDARVALASARRG